MSQTGAYAYTAQGYEYQQILAIYHPSVEIARLNVGCSEKNTKKALGAVMINLSLLCLLS